MIIPPRGTKKVNLAENKAFWKQPETNLIQEWYTRTNNLSVFMHLAKEIR